MKTPSDSDVAQRVRADLELKLARHADALARQDLETALDLYTEDAIVRPANMDAVHGHAGLRQFFSNWWAAMEVQSAEYTTVELDVHGESAYHIGTYTGVQRPQGESVGVHDRGSFMIVWKLQGDHSWKYHRGIFNSSLPATETITSKGEPE